MNLFALHSDPSKLLYHDNKAIQKVIIMKMGLDDAITEFSYGDDAEINMWAIEKELPLILNSPTVREFFQNYIKNQEESAASAQLWWAENVLKGRWREAEEFILSDERAWDIYVDRFLDGDSMAWYDEFVQDRGE